MQQNGILLIYTLKDLAKIYIKHGQYYNACTVEN